MENSSVSSSLPPSVALREDDVYLEQEEFDLDRFVRKAQGIESRDIGEWLEFVIAGINTKSGYRVALNMESHQMTVPRNGRLGLQYDYDSIMGPSKSLPYLRRIELFPLFSGGFKIGHDLHIPPVKVELDHPTPRYVKHAHIPHVMLGQAGPRSAIYLMLPALTSQKPSNNWTIGKSVLEELYGCVRKAAIRVVHSGEAGHWLPTYDAELRRARKSSGQLQTSGRLIPPSKNREFAAELMKNLEMYTWGDEAFFFNQLRGMRGSSLHRKADQAVGLSKFLEDFDFGRESLAEWWIDWGVEISLAGFVLWWKREEHERIIAKILDLSEEVVKTEIMDRKSKYWFDDASQLTEVGGFRSVVDGRHGAAAKIAYIQAYNTEKEATYQLVNGKNVHPVSYSQTLLEDKFKIENHSERLVRIWQDCRTKTNGNARLEVRIRLNQARMFPRCLDLSKEEATNLLYCFPRDAWWYAVSYLLCADPLTCRNHPCCHYHRSFKTVRMRALSQALRWYRESPTGKDNPLAISAVLGLTYMTNALTARSVSWRAEQDILDHMMRDVMEEGGTEGHGLVRNPLGCTFPSSFIADPNLVGIPQFGLAGMQPPHSVFEKLFGKSLATIQTTLQANEMHESTTLRDPTAADRTGRFVNQVRHKETRLARTIVEEEIIVVAPLPSITAADRYSDEEENIGIGPEMEDEARQRGVGLVANPIGQGIDLGDVGHVVTGILARTYMDLLMCAPNTKDHGTACKLVLHERQKASPSVFRDANLAKVWNRCITREVEPEEWNATFCRLFPTHPVRSSRQNYSNCPYYAQWNDLMYISSQEVKTHIQHAVKRLWDTMLWMPWAKSDRIWYQVKFSSGKKLSRPETCTQYPDGCTLPSPVIIINPGWAGDQPYFEPDTM